MRRVDSSGAIRVISTAQNGQVPIGWDGCKHGVTSTRVGSFRSAFAWSLYRPEGHNRIYSRCALSRKQTRNHAGKRKNCGNGKERGRIGRFNFE